MSANEHTDIARHGGLRLPSVIVESYNLEIEDEEGFVGDKANKKAFIDLVSEMADLDESGQPGTEQENKLKVAEVLKNGDARERSIVHSAIEEFAQRLAGVVRRYRRTKGWKEAEIIVVGGGLRGSLAGEIAIHRVRLLLKESGDEVDIRPMSHNPKEAGLIGCAHLAPTWIFGAYESILAVDIGGTNIRCGVVDLHHKDARDLAKAETGRILRWKHADESPSRSDAVERLGKMLGDLISETEKKKLAPFIGIGCPGVINDDGSIKRGGQNLPGNWESSRFNLIKQLKEAIPRIGDHETMMVMHNDAVVQGLSERPFLKEASRWAALTIGTGLGNASFQNRVV